MGEIFLNDFYKTLRKILLGIFIFFMFLGSLLGYIFYKGSPVEQKIKQEKVIAAQIQSALSRGGYIEILQKLQKAGQTEDIDNTLALLKKEGHVDVSLAKTFGVNAFNKLIANAKGNGDESAFNSEDSGSGAFPDIKLGGFIYGKGKATTVFTVAGKPQVWKWEKRDGEWICINPVAGYGVKDITIGADVVEFVLFPLTQSSVSRTYSFGDGVAEQLAQYRQDNHEVLEQIQNEVKIQGGGAESVQQATS